MSWDEGFADRYDEWSADMTADVAFYVGLARQAAGPLVELAIGTGAAWIRFRTLYTVRQLRKPILSAVNGIAYGGGCELAQCTFQDPDH